MTGCPSFSGCSLATSSSFHISSSDNSVHGRCVCLVACREMRGICGCCTVWDVSRTRSHAQFGQDNAWVSVLCRGACRLPHKR